MIVQKIEVSEGNRYDGSIGITKGDTLSRVSLRELHSWEQEREVSEFVVRSLHRKALNNIKV